MGGVQQRTNQVWLTIERNEKSNIFELFDLSKERIAYNSTKICFPSYLHYYEQSKAVTYSLLQDRQNVIAVLDCHESCEQEISLTKVRKRSSDRIWKLMKEGEEIQLKKGQFIKLGRIQLQIKQLKFLFSKQSIKKLTDEVDKENLTVVLPPVFASSSYMQNSDLMSRYGRMKDSDVSHVPSQFMKKSINTEKSNNEQLCRFCFDGTTSVNNPLFNVCRCSGSVKNIHFKCLKNWVKNKMGRVESSHCIYYHYQPLICELCKCSIENQILFNGKMYALYEPEKMHPPFVRLQHTEDGRVFEILIRLEQQANIQIGRGSQNQLNLDDPSISRTHCSFFYSSHRLFLKAKKSKYGTFIQLLKTAELASVEPLQLLIHNNLVTIQHKSLNTGFFNQQCCNIDETYRLVIK